MTKTRTIAAATGLVACLLFGAACTSPADEAAKALKNSGVELDDLGKSIPASFPTADVALPGLKLTSAVGAGGTYALRYVSTDPAGDVAAYRAALAAGGLAISDQYDDLKKADGSPTPSGHTGFVATGPRWSIDVAAFGSGQVDGDYMAIVVQPVSG